MKQLQKILIAATMIACLLCGCSSGTKKETRHVDNGQKIGEEPGTAEEGAKPGTAEEGASGSGGGLYMICKPDGEKACSTQEGYYYLTEGLEDLSDGKMGYHMMYMDYASQQEVYLCSTAGCKHDTADCPAVFLYDDFGDSSRVFVFGGNLYILSRGYDQDGMVITQMGEDGNPVDVLEDEQAVLYRAGLDGTNRQAVYKFDPGLTLEGFVLGDDRGIYVATKKVSSDMDGVDTYITSSERKLMFLDMETFEIREVCSMEFDGDISWTSMIGCSGNSLVLNGTDYGRKLSKEEMWGDDDKYKEIYENSSDVYAVLDIDSGKLRELYRVSNKNVYSDCIMVGDTLYVSSSENQDIYGISIGSGEKKKISSLPQNQIMGSIGGTLCCRDWDLVKDFTYYFVDTETGKVSHSGLVNECNGWALEFRAVLPSDVLVVYDYDAQKNPDNSYEIFQYKYALIPKEDLFSGKKNYRKIKMIGAGM